MRILITLINILLLSNLGLCQTLEEYYIIAADNNPGVQAKYLAFEAAMKRTSQINSLPDPVLSFGYFISPVETRVGPQQARFSLSQMFPWFGSLSARGDASAFRAEAVYQEFLDSRNMLFFRVASSYYSLYELKLWIDLDTENLQVLEAFKSLSTSRFENGNGSLSDVLRADILVNSAETNLSILKKSYWPNQVQFNRLLNQADSTAINVEDELNAGDKFIRDRNDSTLSNNPKVNRLDRLISASEAQELYAKRSGAPSIGIGLDYGIVGEIDNLSIPDNGKDFIMPMVSMSLPIFRSKYRTARDEAQLMQQSYILEKSEVLNHITVQYELVGFEIEKQKDLIELYSYQIKESGQALDLLTTSYSNSGEEFEEVLRMQQQIFMYQKVYVSALAKYHMSKAEMDYITAKSK